MTWDRDKFEKANEARGCCDPSEYYFYISLVACPAVSGPPNLVIEVCPKGYFHSEGCQYDQSSWFNLPWLSELSEGSFEVWDSGLPYNEQPIFTIEEVRERMISAGFEENKAFSSFMKQFVE